MSFNFWCLIGKKIFMQLENSSSHLNDFLVSLQKHLIRSKFINLKFGLKSCAVVAKAFDDGLFFLVRWIAGTNKLTESSWERKKQAEMSLTKQCTIISFSQKLFKTNVNIKGCVFASCFQKFVNNNLIRPMKWKLWREKAAQIKLESCLFRLGLGA